MNTKADTTDRHRQDRPDTSADRMSRGRRSEGEACSDAGAVQSPDQRRRNRSTPNRTDTRNRFSPKFG